MFSALDAEGRVWCAVMDHARGRLWLSATLGGLAGSSCCVLQWALSTALGVSCSGVVALLSPWRAPLTALALLVHAALLWRARPGVTVALSAVLLLALLVSPRVLEPRVDAVTAPSAVLRVGGMGCDACWSSAHAALAAVGVRCALVGDVDAGHVHCHTGEARCVCHASVCVCVCDM